MALTAEAFIILAYEFVVCWGRLSGVMNFSHEACMAVSRGGICLGSLLSSGVAERSRVGLKVYREARREVLGPGLSPFGNLAMITLVGWICSV